MFRRGRGLKGFSLVELIASLAISALILASIIAIMLATHKLYTKLSYRYTMEKRLLDTLDALRVWGMRAESIDWDYINTPTSSSDLPEKVVIKFYPNSMGKILEGTVKEMCTEQLDKLGTPIVGSSSSESCSNIKEIFKDGSELGDMADPFMWLMIRKFTLERKYLGNGKYSYSITEGLFLPKYFEELFSQMNLGFKIEKVQVWHISLIYAMGDKVCQRLEGCGYDVCKTSGDTLESNLDKIREDYFKGTASCDLRHIVRVKEALALDKKSIGEKLADLKEGVAIDYKTGVRFLPPPKNDASSVFIDNTEKYRQFITSLLSNEYFIDLTISKSYGGKLSNEFFTVNIPVNLAYKDANQAVFSYIVDEEGNVLETSGGGVVNTLSQVINLCSASSSTSSCSSEFQGIIATSSGDELEEDTSPGGPGGSGTPGGSGGGHGGGHGGGPGSGGGGDGAKHMP